MTSTVGYELDDSVATITLDDGKVNVLGPDMQAAYVGSRARDHADNNGGASPASQAVW